jgi:ATP-dependent helicase Lhr and Lhr-like helicase
MISSLASNSNCEPQKSSGFDLLHEKVQHWIWQQGWSQLREIQELAIAPILEARTDVIISAATAGGKTEAAFLPIFSKLMEEPSQGIRVLYVSPLKALINDQYRRLSELGDVLDIPIHPWHGDVSSGRKQKVLKNPTGIVLITPESLEALFVMRGSDLAVILRSLNYIVIDELHSFIGSERGKQLQSLMHRVERVVRRPIPRIGLSATLGDIALASDFLRPGKADAVVKINPLNSDGREVRLQVRGYRKPEDEPNIEEHLFKVLRGTNNLIFADSRSAVEKYADCLRRLCEQHHFSNEFLPHHGNLSKELREETEKALRGEHPVSVVCTSTLEMGIDVGAVNSIAQVGAPLSVSSTLQRLGRSGRRETDPATMRVYISEPEATPQLSLEDLIRSKLVQTIAVLNLLLQGWCEPPIISKLHLSTLIQQFLSLVAQHGGVRADQAWQVLCQTGAFRSVDQRLFAELLRCLGAHDLIQQSSDELLLGTRGERLVSHYSFYTAFQTPEEYRIVSENRTLGTLPTAYPLVEGMFLIFAGERWCISSVDQQHKVVDVSKSAAGRVPKFKIGGNSSIHDRVRQEMYRIYTSDDVPTFLDAIARDLLKEARVNFTRYSLNKTPILACGQHTLLFCWMGDTVMNTLMVQLQALGLSVGRGKISLLVEKLSPEEVINYLQEIATDPHINAVDLASTVQNKVDEKYDHFLSPELLDWNYASSCLDVQGAQDTLHRILSEQATRV